MLFQISTFSCDDLQPRRVHSKAIQTAISVTIVGVCLVILKIALRSVKVYSRCVVRGDGVSSHMKVWVFNPPFHCSVWRLTSCKVSYNLCYFLFLLSYINWLKFDPKILFNINPSHPSDWKTRLYRGNNIHKIYFYLVILFQYSKSSCAYGQKYL